MASDQNIICGKKFLKELSDCFADDLIESVRRSLVNDQCILTFDAGQKWKCRLFHITVLTKPLKFDTFHILYMKLHTLCKNTYSKVVVPLEKEKALVLGKVTRKIEFNVHILDELIS